MIQGSCLDEDHFPQTLEDHMLSIEYQILAVAKT